MTEDGDGKHTPTEDDDESSNDNSSASEAELMVTSRVRRATAGNRYSALVAQEDPEEDEEDEVAMLFAEGEGEDEDFNSDEGDDEADMSSSDDDDQGPNAAPDDLEGEGDIQREAKVERAKKRKADLALTTVTGLRKKPRIDPTSLRRASAPKPSKRKERVSWLPESDAAPGRISLRKQTILHRAETHAKLKENEEQRLKLKAKRDKRVREREAAAPKELTQADRLAEAERVERRNAKSLNRWEAMEKKRAEEQAAKLAALKDRKLEGAVVTWYSSSAKYYGLKTNRDTEPETPTEGKKRGRKPKALLEQLAAARLANEQPAVLAPKQGHIPGADQVTIHDLSLVGDSRTASPSAPSDSHVERNTVAGQSDPAPKAPNHVPESGASEDADLAFLTGIHEYASMPPDSKLKAGSVRTSLAVRETVEASREESSQPPPGSEPLEVLRPDEQKQELDKSSSLVCERIIPKVMSAETIQITEPSATVAAPLSKELETTKLSTNEIAMSDADSVLSQKAEAVVQTDNTVQPLRRNDGDASLILNEVGPTQLQSTSTTVKADHNSTAALSVEPPIEVISTRNLLILEKFDHLSDQGRSDFGLFFNNRKAGKPVKHSQELCAVTGLPARYRDPSTGIPYANTTAYKKLQELKKHQFTWSGMLECYVGRTSVVARGVPEGFLGT